MIFSANGSGHSDTATTVPPLLQYLLKYSREPANRRSSGRLERSRRGVACVTLPLKTADVRRWRRCEVNTCERGCCRRWAAGEEVVKRVGVSQEFGKAPICSCSHPQCSRSNQAGERRRPQAFERRADVQYSVFSQ